MDIKYEKEEKKQEEKTEEIIEKQVFEIEVPEITPKKEKKQSQKEEQENARVIKIKKDSILLEDEKGHGINIPKTNKHKDIKVGDIIGL